MSKGKDGKMGRQISIEEARKYFGPDEIKRIQREKLAVVVLDNGEVVAVKNERIEKIRWN